MPRFIFWVGLALAALVPLADASAATLRLEYYRFDHAYAGWGLHLWDNAGSTWQPTSWTTYPQFTDGSGTMAQSPWPTYTTGVDTVGGKTFQTLSFDASALPGTAVLKFLVHLGNTKDLGGADQTWPTVAGVPVSTVYCVEGDPTVYTDPGAATAATTIDVARAQLITTGEIWFNLNGPSDGTATPILRTADGTTVAVQSTLSVGQTVGLLTPAAGGDFDLAGVPFRLQWGSGADHAVGASPSVIDHAAALHPAATQPLGPQYAAGAVTLSFWSPLARSVTVDFYAHADDPISSPTGTWAMTRGTGGVWTANFPVPTTNAYYQFAVDFGEASGPRHVLDPYATTMGLWRQAAWANVDPVGKGYLVDTSTIGPTGGWAAVPVTHRRPRDAVIYEASVRDQTSDPFLASLGTARGTYGAFAQTLPYLKNLGVTHIQLMPVLQNYYYDQSRRDTYESGRSASQIASSTTNYNWGYDPHNYFTPTGMYSSNPSDPTLRVKELKDLVNAIHQAGLRVILDVVYNHTAVVNVLNDAVPGYYYRLSASGDYLSNSGCGNDVRTEGTMARRLIVDSIVHWVSEYKVDGFRFDILGMIDTQTIAQAYQAAQALNPDILFEGEGWAGLYDGASQDASGTLIAGSDQAHTGWLAQAGAPVGMFNDSLRSLLKGGGYTEGPGFVTGQAAPYGSLFQNLLGNVLGGYTPASRDNVMTYLTVHDNLCLYDAVAHGLHLGTGSADTETALRRMRIGYAAVLTSQGVAFLYGGDEFFRSREVSGSSSSNAVTDPVTGRTFVSNAYKATDEINHLPWSQLYTSDPLVAGFGTQATGTPGAALSQYVQGLVALRQSSDAFRQPDGALPAHAQMFLPNP